MEKLGTEKIIDDCINKNENIYFLIKFMKNFFLKQTTKYLKRIKLTVPKSCSFSQINNEWNKGCFNNNIILCYLMLNDEDLFPTPYFCSRQYFCKVNYNKKREIT